MLVHDLGFDSLGVCLEQSSKIKKKKKEIKTMAKKLTRTITETVGKVLVFTEDETIKEMEVKVSGKLNPRKFAREAAKLFGWNVVKVKEVSYIDTKYEMLESDFIAGATPVKDNKVGGVE